MKYLYLNTAADTTILATIPRGLSDRSNLDLSKFTDWTEANGMQCNASKCKELLLHKK